MVLKKKIIILYLQIFISISCYSQDTTDISFWTKFFQTAFDNSKNVFNLKQEHNSTLISKKQYDYQWFPQLQVSLQETTTITRGDGIYLINQEPSSELATILTPFMNFSIIQKLPGQGSISLSTGYGFNYVADRNAFMQFPQINLNFSQYLGRGAFGITGNIDNKLINEKMDYTNLTFRKNLSSEIIRIFSLLQQYDELSAEENYYTSLVTQYKSELETAKQKEITGMQSKLQSHYANHQLTEALTKLEEIKTQNKHILKEIQILNPDFKLEQLKSERTKLKDFLNKLYLALDIKEESLNSNLDNEIYESMKKQLLLQFQVTENNYAPVLVISSTLNPNDSIFPYYSDWYKSFRIFKETDDPLTFSLSVGIQKSFEIPQARKIRKEIYELNQKSIANEIEFYKKNIEKELPIAQTQITSDLSYIETLDKEIIEENSYREKRKALFEQNIITQDEYLKSETQYYLIMKQYLNSYWNIISYQLQIINLYSKDDVILKCFLGENYDKIY